MSGAADFTAWTIEGRFRPYSRGGCRPAGTLRSPRAARPRWCARDFVEAQIVGLLAMAEAVPALREGAEFAAVGADVGVVDVAVDHIGDDVAGRAQRAGVGGAAHGGKVRPARLEQPDDLGLRRTSPADGALERCAQVAADGRFSGSDAGDLRGGQRLIGTRRPIVLAREALRYRFGAGAEYAARGQANCHPGRSAQRGGRDPATIRQRRLSPWVMDSRLRGNDAG